VNRCKMHTQDVKISTDIRGMKPVPRDWESHKFKKMSVGTSSTDITIETSPVPPRTPPPDGGDIELRSPTRQHQSETKIFNNNETKNPL